MTRLIIWRHGQTSWNVENRIQGQRDVGLDASGQQQASLAAHLLAEEPADLLISSDLRRARDTAEVLAALNGRSVEVDPRLRERRYGDWEGMTHEQIDARWPEEFRRWRRGGPVPECGLEDPAHVAKRVFGALVEVAERVGDGTAIVVSHGGAARQGVGAVLGWPASVVRQVGPLANCHWTELRGGPMNWRLYAHNVGPRGTSGTGTPDEPATGTAADQPVAARYHPMLGTPDDPVASEKL